MIKYILIAILLPCLLWAEHVNPLSDSKADEIIRQEMEAKAQKTEAEIERLESVSAIESAEANMDGRKVIYNRVAPQRRKVSAPQMMQQTSSTKSQLNAAEIAALRHELETRKTISLFLSCTVYDGVVTELEWAYDGVAYRAFVNLNFHYLSSIGQLEADGVFYSIIAAVGDDTRENLERTNRQAQVEGWPNYTPKWVPALTDFSSDGIEFIIVAESNDTGQNEAAFAGIETITRHYLENEEALKISYQRSQALRDARERYLEANPPQPKDTIINFAPTAESKSLRNQ